MTKQWLGRLPGLAAMVALGGILLLAARVDVQTFEVRESSTSRRHADLVSCVLPAPAIDPSTSPAGVPDAMIPDCDASSTPDHLRPAWMTAC
jgi:hypothetical protein